jgi:hypothetical protein
VSPLNVEIKRQGAKWKKIGTKEPGQTPESLSNIRRDGRRNIYVYECGIDDTFSLITVHRGGVEGEGQSQKEVFGEGEVVKRLKNGQSKIIHIRSSEHGGKVSVRFKHIKEK